MIALILFSVFSFSSLPSVIYDEAQMISSVMIHDTPTYFFKPSPDGRYYAYTTWSGADGHDVDKNILFDSLTGEYIPIPGRYDPVFTLNLRNVVLPGIEGLHFYHAITLKEQQRQAEPYYVDLDFVGVYESVAILKSSPREIIYRIIIENGKRFFRDYKETIDHQNRTTSIKPLGPVSTLCSNYGFSLPMISKDGTEVGGLDHITGKSRIYEITNSGDCKVKEDLNQVAGKMAFSYNKRYVAYHVFDKVESLGTGYTRGHITLPAASTSSNIYLKDRFLNKVYRISNYVNANAMYPEFLQNGDLVYIVYPHNTQHKPRFVRVRPNSY